MGAWEDTGMEGAVWDGGQSWGDGGDIGGMGGDSEVLRGSVGWGTFGGWG